MGYGNCGTDSNGRPIGYANDGQCDHIDCSKIIDRGMSYACGGEHGDTEYSCEDYFCEEHKRQPSLDDDHDYYVHGMGSLCNNCATDLELSEKPSHAMVDEAKIKLDPELLQCGDFDRPLFAEITELEINLDGPTKVKDAPEYKIPAPKFYQHQLDAYAQAMNRNPFFSMPFGGRTILGIDPGAFKKANPELPTGVDPKILDKPDGRVRGGISPLTGLWETGGTVSGRWKASDVSGKPNETHIVRGDIVATFKDPELYETMKKGHEELQRDIAQYIDDMFEAGRKEALHTAYGGTAKGKTKYVYEQLLAHLEKNPEHKAGRVTKDGGFESFTKEQLKKELGIGTVFGIGHRTLREHKDLVRRFKTCPPAHRFKHHGFKHRDPEFIPGKETQSENRALRVGVTAPVIEEMFIDGEISDVWINGKKAEGLEGADYSKLEERILATLENKKAIMESAVYDSGDPWEPKAICVHKNGRRTIVDLETMAPSDQPKWPCPGEEPPRVVVEVDIPETDFVDKPSDGWDKIEGAPTKKAVLDTWDLAMKKPK